MICNFDYIKLVFFLIYIASLNYLIFFIDLFEIVSSRARWNRNILGPGRMTGKELSLNTYPKVQKIP